ncbi:MAG: recombinase family protein [Erysipelotrichaceae bacterium]|nr:recombinase family protein [Erysipelotrichaceae bacterium]
MSNIAYIRVSTEDQNTARQRELFKDLKIDKYFEEKVSGKNIKDRPELIKMMDYVREGDTVIVESISRFGRSLSNLISLIEQLNNKGVKFKSLKEGDIDTTTPQGKLVFSIFSSLAEFERETIKQRQAEGIAIAKANGKYKGRVKKPIDQNEFISLYNRWQDGEIQKKYICKKLNVSMATLDRRIAEYRKANNKQFNSLY